MHVLSTFCATSMSHKILFSTMQVVPIYYFTTIVMYYRISSSRFYAPFFLPKTRESILNSLGNLQFLRDLQDRSRIMEVFLHLSSNVWYSITAPEEAVHIRYPPRFFVQVWHHTSHSAYVATDTELHGAKIDGSL